MLTGHTIAPPAGACGNADIGKAKLEDLLSGQFAFTVDLHIRFLR